MAHLATMKLLFLVLLSLIVNSCSPSEVSNSRMSPANVFSKLDFDRVVAYDFNGEEEDIIDRNGQLTSAINKQTQLTESQTIGITNILCNKATYGGPLMMCFNPRLGLVFYKNNVPKAHVSICLECNYARSSIEIPQAIDGFSSTGQSTIKKFSNQIGF